MITKNANVRKAVSRKNVLNSLIYIQIVKIISEKKNEKCCLSKKVN